MDYSLLDLRVFEAACRLGSLGRAATALQLSQPSVSARMRSLERAVGSVLVFRSRAGVSVTPAGARFLPVAERMLELASKGAAAAHDEQDVGRFVLGVHGTLAPSVVPRFAAVLGDESVELYVRDAHSADLVRLVGDGELDAAVVIPVAVPANVEIERVLDDVIACVASPDHEAAGAAMDARQLRKWPLAVNTWGDAAGGFAELLVDAAIPRRNVRWVATAATAIELAVELGHVAVLPRSAVERIIDRGDLVDVRVKGLPRWTLPLLFAYRRGDRDVEAIGQAAFSGRRLRRAAGRSLRS